MTHFRSSVAIVLALLITATISLRAQVMRDNGTDIQLHKFRPRVTPEQATHPSTGQDANAFAAQQIVALEQEKSSRTPAQQKIDSNLLYTIRMMRGQPAAPGVPFLHTGVDVDQNDNLVVDITANVTDALLKQLSAAGAVVLYSNANFHSIRAIVPPHQVESIAASADVIFIAPKAGYATAGTWSGLKASPLLKPGMRPGFAQRAARIRKQLAAILASGIPGTPRIGSGSVDTEGDLTHRAFDARGAFGVTGAGLKIGVLSDSANATGAATSAQATGDLPPTCPGPGGPCLTIVQDVPLGFGADEGTAIMEIVYDLAPGASLFFATADNGEASFAQNILNLQSVSHCDIILDDVFYFDEPVFQDGIVAQAVTTVTAAGALYFSSAGNEGNVDNNTAGYFEGDFNDAGSPAFTFPPSLGTKTGTIHNFGTVSSPLNGDIIVFSGFAYTLNWADPQGASGNDYDLFVVDSTGVVKASSTNTQNGTQNPYEQVNPPFLVTGDRLVVFKTAASKSVAFAINTLRGNLSINTRGQTHGHSAASGTGIFSVAATPAAAAFNGVAPAGPFPGPFTTANSVEPFTSDGSRRVFFNADGSAITPGSFTFASGGGTVRPKPDITGADGVSTTLPSGSGLNPFYGTSAAAPHAAAIAALLKSANPALTQTQIRTALTTTAVVPAAGSAVDFGAGIVMAFEAVSSLGIPGGPNLELNVVTAQENPGDGDGALDAGEAGLVTIQLTNAGGLLAATGITATLTSSTPGVVMTLPNTSAYADVAAGAIGGNNLTPLTFTLANNLACGAVIDFTLTLAYNGGSTRALDFTVPTGSIVSFTNNLGTTPAPASGVTTATGTQTGRLFRNGVGSVCGASKPNPGLFDSVSRAFDSYTFTACQTGCMTAVLKSPNGINLYEAAFSPAFVPANPSTNFAADPGASSSVQSFGLSVTAGTQYSIVVNDISTVPSGSNYTLQVPKCALSCTPFNLTPTAASVSVTAGQSVTEHITVTPTPAIVNALTFSCSGLPALSACAFSPQTVPPGSSPTDVTVTITTTATTTHLGASVSAPERPGTFYAACLPFTGLGLIGIVLLGKRKNTSRKTPETNRKAAAAVCKLAFMALLLGLVACGGHSTPPPVTVPGTPLGTSTVTVTATSSSATRSTTFTLTVQ
ncbi:MAG TPA: S8 family serine peptidase [Verrucomicrobiae bacterium]|nr:S8 family serine peptidase [Verrucomicrobiae bacterium]